MGPKTSSSSPCRLLVSAPSEDSNHTEKGNGPTLFERLASKRMQVASGATELGGALAAGGGDREVGGGEQAVELRNDGEG